MCEQKSYTIIFYNYIFHTFFNNPLSGKNINYTSCFQNFKERMVVGIPDKTSIKLSLFQNQNLTLN